MKARGADGLSEQPGGLLASAVRRRPVPRPPCAGGCAEGGTAPEEGPLQWASWQLATSRRGFPLRGLVVG